MLNLDATIELDFRKFLKWWRKELAFLVPERFKHLITDQRSIIVIQPVGSHFELLRVGLNPDVLAVLSRDENGAAQFKALLEKDEKLVDARYILRLEKTQGISRELTLPAAAKENLLQVMSYELSRFTPFNPEQVYFAVKLLGTPGEPGMMQALLVLTPRSILDGLHADLRALGISPLLVDYAGAANELEALDEAYDLLPERFRIQTSKTSDFLYAGIAGGLLLLVVIAVFLPAFFEYRTVALLQEKIDTIEKDAKKIKAMQSDIDATITETEDLVREKNNSPPVIEMLNTLSTLIDDKTWLTYLQLADNHLQIQGESPSASGLIAVVEDSTIFSNAKFVSPVTQDTTTGLERFQITADIVVTEGSGGQRTE